MKYLGFEFSQFVIETVTRKVNCVKSFPVSTNVKALRSFVDLASYFRRFVKGFASIIKRLSDLLKKNEIFAWGTDQQRAFDEIKLRLSSSPILAIFNIKAKTEVHTDASQYGLGAVLLQERQVSKLARKMHPVCYYS